MKFSPYTGNHLHEGMRPDDFRQSSQPWNYNPWDGSKRTIKDIGRDPQMVRFEFDAMVASPGFQDFPPKPTHEQRLEFLKQDIQALISMFERDTGANVKQIEMDGDLVQVHICNTTAETRQTAQKDTP
jgi:ribosome recycling factor